MNLSWPSAFTRQFDPKSGLWVRGCDMRWHLRVESSASIGGKCPRLSLLSEARTYASLPPRHMIRFLIRRANIKVIKGAVVDWLKIILFLLDDAAALFLIIWLLQALNIQLPLPIIILIAVLVGAFVFIGYEALVPDSRRRPVTGKEGMVGLEGRVVETLSPVGIISVGGEHWRAKSVDGDVGVDESVEILGVERLTLRVRRKRQ